MAHISKVINGYLILLIILLTFFTIGITFRNNQRFEKQEAELTDKTISLSQLRTELKKQAGDRGESLLNEKNQCIQELEDRERELRTVKTDLGKKNDELLQMISQLQTATGDLDQLRQENDELQNNYNDCRNDLQSHLTSHVCP